jgi:glycosyltransferase involved in cell wall biosynthesis
LFYFSLLGRDEEYVQKYAHSGFSRFIKNSRKPCVIYTTIVDNLLIIGSATGEPTDERGHFASQGGANVMRIAIIAEVYLPKVDGVVIRTMNLIRHLLDRGDEILVVAPQVDGRRDSPVPVVEFRSFPFPAYPEYRIGLPDARLVRAIDDFAPDILHYINPFAFGFRCRDILLGAGTRVPAIFSFHTLYGEFVKRYPLLRPLAPVLWWLMRDYHNTADRNLTVSAIMQDDLKERGFERVELWPPAVDCELFDPRRASAEMRQRLSHGRPERPLLVTVSRLAPEKNVGFLADVLRQVPEAQLAVVGDGPDRPALERRFAGTNARFFGYMKGEELATAYASADAFIYASETETMGNVVLEAMAAGLGVAAPRAGGIPSLVSHGQTGLLYRPGDTQDAVAAVRRLLDRDGFGAQTGRAARAAVEAWGWNHSTERVREHYLETIDRWKQGVRVARHKRRLGPAMVRALVTAYRAQAFVGGHRQLPRIAPAAGSPVGVAKPHLLTQGGIHGRQPEGAGT